jgi:hypothetical protein
MRTYIPYLLAVLSTVIFTILLTNSENKVNKLQQDIKIQSDSLSIVIDSLTSEIDTLIWESEIWDQNTENNTTYLLSAIMHVESGHNDSAYCASEDAVGCLQIRQCMVDDVNRILGRQKVYKRYTYEDRWSRYRSIEMFDIFCKHYGLNSAEEIARCWNGGPRGINNPATVSYWNKVEKQIKENS